MKFYHTFALSTILCLGVMGTASAAKPTTHISVVDFATCIQQSKYGKREQQGFEGLKQQMHSILDDTEKQLNAVVTKLQDTDYLDSLSPEAEQELQSKFRALQEELGRYQNHYYQILQQANMRMIHSMAGYINRASEEVAKKKQIPMVLNKEAAFYYDSSLDITGQVVDRMDKDYEIADKEGRLPPTTQTMMPNPKQMLQQGSHE